MIKNYYKVVDALFDTLLCTIKNKKLLTMQDIENTRGAVKEAIHGIILETHSKGIEGLQGSLFQEQDNVFLEENKENPFSFDMLWSVYPKKSGKKKAKIFWQTEIGKKNEVVIRVWNALYYYLIDIRKTRREGFFRQYKDGEQFVKNYTDYIGYQDNLLLDIQKLIEKCKALVKQISDEDEINLQAANIQGRSVNLQKHYKREW